MPMSRSPVQLCQEALTFAFAHLASAGRPLGSSDFMHSVDVIIELCATAIAPDAAQARQILASSARLEIDGWEGE